MKSIRRVTIFFILLTQLAWAGGQLAKQNRIIQHPTCILNVLKLPGIGFSPSAEKTLTTKGYKVIETDPEIFASRAESDELFLAFETYAETKKRLLVHDLELRANIALKQVIYQKNGMDNAILDSSETTSVQTLSECQHTKLKKLFEEDKAAFLLKYCGPLLNKLVKDIPACQVTAGKK
jgi:hypothetical protein